MKSRRLMCFSSRGSHPTTSLKKPLVHHSILAHPTSATGQTRSFGDVGSMSALAHFADSSRTSPEVREVPIPVVSRCSKMRVHKPRFTQSPCRRGRSAWVALISRDISTLARLPRAARLPETAETAETAISALPRSWPA
jgi:hypothetical protein